MMPDESTVPNVTNMPNVTSMPNVTIMPYKESKPQIAPSVFIASGARIIGDVVIGEQSSIWYNTVLRGDVNYIRIGKMTNIQDNTVIHVASKGAPAIIGDKVTVGHQAMIHACTIGDLCLIGMGAIILDDAVIGEQCLVAAGAVVTPGKVFPPRMLIMGTPAQIKRPLNPEELAALEESAQHYMRLARSYG